jgi:hypothetical protein
MCVDGDAGLSPVVLGAGIVLPIILCCCIIFCFVAWFCGFFAHVVHFFKGHYFTFGKHMSLSLSRGSIRSTKCECDDDIILLLSRPGARRFG